MRVRRTIALVGPDIALAPGDVVDVPEAVAREWIEIGHAVPADAVERATAKPAPEAATAKPQRKARKKKNEK